MELDDKLESKSGQKPQGASSCKLYDTLENPGLVSTSAPNSEAKIGSDDEVIIVGFKAGPPRPSIFGSRPKTGTRGGTHPVAITNVVPPRIPPVTPFSRPASSAILPTHLADTRSTEPCILPGDIHIAPIETPASAITKDVTIDLALIPDPNTERLLIAKRLADADDRLQTDKDEIERLIHSTISNINANSSPKRLIKHLEVLVAIGHHVIARRNEKVPEPSNPWTDEVMQKLLTDSMLKICHMVGGNPKPRDFEFKYPHLLKNITVDMMDLNRKGQLGKIKCLAGMGRVLSWFGLLGRCLADPRCVD